MRNCFCHFTSSLILSFRGILFAKMCSTQTGLIGIHAWLSAFKTETLNLLNSKKEQKIGNEYDTNK